MKKWISAVLIGTILAGMLALPANATASFDWQDYVVMEMDAQTVTDTSNYLIKNYNGYSEGLALVTQSGKFDGQVYMNDPLYYMDMDGNVAIDVSDYTSATSFYQGYACVYNYNASDARYALIDTTGNVVYEKPDWAWNFYWCGEGVMLFERINWEDGTDGETMALYYADDFGTATQIYTSADIAYASVITCDGTPYIQIKHGNAFSADTTSVSILDTSGHVLLNFAVDGYEFYGFEDGIAEMHSYSDKSMYAMDLTGKTVYSSSDYSVQDECALSALRGYDVYVDAASSNQVLDANTGNVLFSMDNLLSTPYGNWADEPKAFEIRETTDSGYVFKTYYIQNPLLSGETVEEETTYGQSILKLETASLVDMIYNNLEISITNNTDTKDVGTFAFVAADDFAIIHFIEYELEPYTTQTVTVITSGLFSSDVNMGIEYLTSGWDGVFNATFITFEDEADMLDYFSHVTYEQHETRYKGAMNMNQNHSSFSYDTDTSLICHGDPGTQWLANYTDISYITLPYVYDTDDHSICEVD